MRMSSWNRLAARRRWGRTLLPAYRKTGRLYLAELEGLTLTELQRRTSAALTQLYSYRIGTNTVKAAGFRRNKQIAMPPRADECLVFWDGTSKGTQHFIKSAFELRKPLYIIGPDALPWAVFDEEYYEQEGPNARMDIPKG